LHFLTIEVILTQTVTTLYNTTVQVIAQHQHTKRTRTKENVIMVDELVPSQ